MENANKYRIRVETINGNEEELRAEYRLGTECEGFAILYDYKDSNALSVHHMSLNDLAEAICNQDQLLEAAYIAIGMLEGRRAVQTRLSSTVTGALKNMPDLFQRLFGNEDEE